MSSTSTDPSAASTSHPPSNSTNNAADEFDDDEEDDEDEVAIVLDSASSAPSRGISIKGKFNRGDSSLTSTAAPAYSDAAPAPSNASHPFRLPFPNDTVYELDLDSVTDKPWRKAGADLTDWFNYGFDEDTWRHYATKQIALRIQSKQTKDQSAKDGKSASAPPATASAPASSASVPPSVPLPAGAGVPPFNPAMAPYMMPPMNPAMYRPPPGAPYPPQFPYPPQAGSFPPSQNQSQNPNPHKRSRES